MSNNINQDLFSNLPNELHSVIYGFLGRIGGAPRRKVH